MEDKLFLPVWFWQYIFIAVLGSFLLIPIRKGGIRKQSWEKIIVGLVMTVCVFWLGQRLVAINHRSHDHVFTLASLPIVYAAVGFFELLSGKSFLRDALTFNSRNSDTKNAIGLLAVFAVVALGA